MLALWRRMFEEMNRAAFYGDTYRLQRGEVVLCPIARERARRIAFYCYQRTHPAGSWVSNGEEAHAA